MSQFPAPPGLLQMLKEGTMYMDDADDQLMNISTCANMTKNFASSFGPNGMNKLIINHIQKISITNDAAAMINQMELQNPAAKILMYAAQIQEEEVGDGTNFVIVFTGALLENAKELIKSGLSIPEIVEGFTLGKKKALELLPGLTCDQVKNFDDQEEMVKFLKSSIMSKQYGNEDFLTPLITKACIMAKAHGKDTFNVDNIRVCKILGSGIQQSTIISGMVFKYEVQSDITTVKGAKIAVYSCAFDTLQTETKGTVLIKSAAELKSYSQGEENLLESQIKAIVDSGCNVVVTGGKIGDMALHFANKHELLLVRLTSKFDVRRIARATQARVMPSMEAPSKEDLGHCDKVYIDEIGETHVVIFNQEKEDSALVTIVVRGSSDNIMDDIERAIDDGVNNYKALTRDPRVVPGASATEVELSLQISAYGDSLPGLEQYAVKKFGESFLSIPKALGENAGIKSVGVPTIKDVCKDNIYDPLVVKEWAIKYATHAASIILSIDKIIMAKPAGGPTPRAVKREDDD